MAIVLVLVGAFVYTRVADDLSSSIDDALRTRADDLARQVQNTDPDEVGLAGERSEGAEDILSEVVRANGKVVASSDAFGSKAVLSPSELQAASRGLVYFDPRPVPGIEEKARLLARPVTSDEGRFVVAVGASTGDRAETLSGLATTFAIGGPLALLLASGLGCFVASLGMRPVEAMRSRASRITLERADERLPVPAADDEIGRLAATLNEMLARIEQSLERQRGFVADAGHELRTPLAILRGELELGLRHNDDPQTAATAFASAIEEADSLQQLADDLLELARSDAGQLKLQLAGTRINELLDRCRSRFISRAESQGRSIEMKAADDLEWTLDAERVRSMIGNLIENSLRYGEGAIRLSAEVNGDLRIEVSDEGPGFPPEFASTAFDRFTRAESGRTTPGTGLGLAIVAAIAEAHGGTAAIESSGAGATVTISLPPAVRRD
ncbi:MAG: HAMP domain-containing sensor histidine kinase [Solirubrobacterales bacterium]